MSSRWFERLLLHHQDHGLQPPGWWLFFFFYRTGDRWYSVKLISKIIKRQSKRRLVTERR